MKPSLVALCRLAGSLAILVPHLAPAAYAEAPVPVVGVLSAGPGPSSSRDPSAEAFARGLTERGWIPGQTIRIDNRYAGGKAERLEGLARELVQLKVDVIVARAASSIRAAQQATTSIPIVMSASGHDPVQLGFVASFAHPGANITGLTLLIQDLQAKQLQVLREVVPRLSRVVVLGSRASPLPRKARQDVEAAAEALDLQLQHVDLSGAADLDRAFEDMARARIGGLLVRSDPFVLEPNVRRVTALAVKHRIPAIYWLDAYPQAGGLMSYGADLLDIHRRSAFYVDRLLRGARPADLPVEEPRRLALVLNVKAAQAIGLVFQSSVLARANEILQ